MTHAIADTKTPALRHFMIFITTSVGIQRHCLHVATFVSLEQRLRRVNGHGMYNF
jgi:hypothetical protein